MQGRMPPRIALRAVVGGAVAMLAAALGVASALAGDPPGAAPAGAALVPAPAIRYGRDIRPLLSDRCFLCHGPDRATQKAGLRLDSFEDATAAREDGAAIVPGKPDESLLLQRITTTDPDTVMPPPDSGKHAVTAAEAALLRQWIAEGARYEKHWAFVPPVRAMAPAVKDAAWPRAELDRFVLANLERQGAHPSAEADRATLCRRVFLDLTGLPPTPEESTAFLTDERPDSYERLVDRLLTEEPYRTRYAERMAVPWLDVARYADTSGIHMDAGRQMWLWRDWVIKAFRDNKPYDRFIVEQLAGDLMPDATVDQKIASGFNRAHVTSDEGGAIEAEYLLEYAVDRTSTVGAAFLGLTLHCARCHDHKFDPVTQEDFYGLLAFFNSVEQPGIYSQVPDPNRAHEPAIEVPTPEHAARLGPLEKAVADLKAVRSQMSDGERAELAAFTQQLREASVAWAPTKAVAATSAGGVTLAVQPDNSVLASGANPANDEQVITLRTDATGLRVLALEALTDPSTKDRVGRAPNGNAVLDAIELEAVSVADPAKKVTVPLVWAWADVEQADGDYPVANVLRADGRVWAVGAHFQPGPRAAMFVAGQPFGFPGGTELRVKLTYRSPYAQHSFARVRLTAGAAPDAFVATLPPATGRWHIVGPFPFDDGNKAYDRTLGPEESRTIDPSKVWGTKQDGEFRWRFAPGVLENTPVNLAQGVDAEFVGREIWSAGPGELELALGSDDGLQVFVNGTRVFEHRIDRGVMRDQEHVKIPLQAGANALVCKVVNTGGTGGFFHREELRPTDTPRAMLALAMPPGSVRPEVAEAATDGWRAQRSPRFRDLSEQLAKAESERAKVAAGLPRTMVMKERAMPVETFVMKRGLYDQPDKDRPVQRAIPKVLGALPPGAAPNRLGLAEWLVGDTNPLTARVLVNRLWEQFFGRGLVRSTEDFGLQGEWPTHPELLDWLAVDFRTHGWDLQRLVRQIVTSATYRQSSAVRPELAAVDPDDRLLGWFPRQRLAAEQIRDQALYVGGLLKEQVGGPSVKPYQPVGLWEETSMLQSNTRSYEQGKGDDLWRRSLYTYWKRASPPPSMLALDAPTREFCTVRRFATNTPLQALVLWNDPQFVEAARNAAARTLREPGDDRARLARLWLRSTGSVATPAALDAMQATLAAERTRWAGPGAEDAAKLLSVGESPVPADLDRSELASWTMIANAVLASDPVIVKD